MRLPIAFFAVSLWSVPALAEDTQELTVDSAHSLVSFLAHTTLHEFTGNAPGASGSLSLKSGMPVSGVVEVPVARIDTGSGGRDNDMRGENYLNAPKFPALSFRFVQLVGPPVPESGQAHGTLKGTFRVKGTEREISVPVVYGWTQGRLEVSGSFPVDIRDFGLPVPVVFVIQRMDPMLSVTFRVGFQKRG
jgi:polyisoprenoid-binding protein YceI